MGGFLEAWVKSPLEGNVRLLREEVVTNTSPFWWVDNTATIAKYGSNSLSDGLYSILVNSNKPILGKHTLEEN